MGASGARLGDALGIGGGAERAWRRSPAKLRVVLELPSNEAVRAAVEAGMGATAISASVAAASLEAGLLHQVPVKLPDRAFCALSHAERTRSPAADRLLALIRN